MKDVGPDDMARFRRVEDAFRAVCARWAFEEIRTPLLEHLYLYTSAGTLSPELLGRVYSFLDWDGWSGERVVLRPDSTIAAARFLQEEGRPQPSRLFYVQNVFRFAADDEDRELWQCGAELVGDTEPRGDLELILIALEVLEALELPKIVVKVSHTGIVRALLAATSLPTETQAAMYDRILAADSAVVAELEACLPSLEAPLHVLFETTGGSTLAGNLRAVFERALPSLASPFSTLGTVAAVLESLGVAVQVVTALARDFEYYTGTVFRFQADDREVGAGGRYDALLRNESGRQPAASGFMLEVDKLARLLPAPAEPKGTPLLVRALDDAPATIAAALAAVRTAHRRGASARLAAPGERGTALEVGGTPPAFSWGRRRIEERNDAVAVALGLAR